MCYSTQIKGSQNLTWKEWLKELLLFSLEKSRLREDVITIFQYLKECYKDASDWYFMSSWGKDKNKDVYHKTKIFRLCIRRKISNN